MIIKKWLIINNNYLKTAFFLDFNSLFSLDELNDEDELETNFEQS